MDLLIVLYADLIKSDYKILDNATHINIQNSNITILKFNLPPKLKFLNASENNLISFKLILPESLQYLYLRSNKILSFNCIIPSALKYLDVSHNRLKKIKLNRVPEKIYCGKIKNYKTCRKKYFYIGFEL